MSRGEGFDVMDLSTSWHDDPKWKVIWRRRPDLIAPCAYVYVTVAAESWRIGSRMTVQDAWPALILYDAEVVAELLHAKLIDRTGRVLVKTWQSWFDIAAERRETARARNRRANDNRRHGANPNGIGTADTALSQRTDSAVTMAPVPTGPTVPSDPTDPIRPDDGRVDLEAFLATRYRPPTPAQRQLMDTYCRVFDVTGPDRAARLIFAHPDDPIGALKDDLAAFRQERSAKARAEEAPTPAPRRRSSGLTGVNAEIAALLREQDAQRAAKEIA